MKRLFAIVFAVIVVVAALPLGAAAAPEFIGEVTVSIPGYDGLDITLSDAASRWADHVESMYGTYNMIVVAPDSTVTFSRDVALNNMGAPSGSAAAGTAVSISSIDGNYVYADDGVLYTIFSTTSSQSYTEESLNKDIAEIAAGAPASVPPPATTEPPAPAAPPPAAGGQGAISLPEISGLEITLSDAYDNYAYGPFIFNPVQNAYTFYLNPAGTVTFSRDVTVVKTDMMTYAQTEVPVSGGAATPIADINGAALYFDDAMAGFATFADLTDPTYAAGLSTATIPLSALGSGGGGSAPAPAPAEPGGSAPAPAAPPPAAPAPAGEAPTATEDDVVYISVSVNGVLEVAAQPVKPGSEWTVQDALIEAHRQFYPEGEDGYGAGIDAMYNMFLINTFWGVPATPYVAINNAILQATADTSPVQPNDNIVVSVYSDASLPVVALSLTADVDGGSAVITATNWVLDFATFSYTSSPFAGANVVDPATGASLGTTDADGKVTVPAQGIAAIDGYAAIPVDGSSRSYTGAPMSMFPTGTAGSAGPSYIVFDAEMKRIYAVGVPIAGGLLVVCLINISVQSKKYKYLDVYYK
ncbi:MAG: hypothetical protein LBJ84_06510 [Oscillospiraceae bacterium]|jgi:hypothetical protein|nr:hypothetical protein [Oscillospiraceae bacterium]